MELLIYKDERAEYTYYLGKTGEVIRHGEYKDFYANGMLWGLMFFYHGKCHGEYKAWWNSSGKLMSHCFYINNECHPYVEMSEQEKLLFQIKYPGFRFIQHEVPNSDPLLSYLRSVVISCIKWMRKAIPSK